MPVLYHHGFSKTKLNNMEEPITDKILKEIDLVHSADVYDALKSKRSYHEPFSDNIIYDVLSKDYMCSEDILSGLKEFKKN